MAFLMASAEGGPLLRLGTYFVNTCSGLLPEAAQLDCSCPMISAIHGAEESYLPWNPYVTEREVAVNQVQQSPENLPWYRLYDLGSPGKYSISQDHLTMKGSCSSLSRQSSHALGSSDSFSACNLGIN